jgi:hypothetical protein
MMLAVMLAVRLQSILSFLAVDNQLDENED